MSKQIMKTRNGLTWKIREHDMNATKEKQMIEAICCTRGAIHSDVCYPNNVTQVVVIMDVWLARNDG